MVNSTYKFYYFDWTGLGEITRLIFALNDVKYEEVRIPMEPNFPQLSPEWKAKTPWGQVPMLEVDGRKYAQASAINRFLARRFNMAGADEYESAKVDELADAIKDWTTEWQKLFAERDPTKQAEIKKQILETANKKYLGKFNTIIAQNGGKGLVGDKTTWADVYLCHLATYFESFCFMEYIKDYPAIDALVQNFYNKPQVKNWIANRPKPAMDFNYNIFNEIMANMMKK